MRKTVIDLRGAIFGRWTVLRRSKNNARGAAQWLCRCSCGTEREIIGYKLRANESKSCGECTPKFRRIPPANQIPFAEWSERRLASLRAIRHQNAISTPVKGGVGSIAEAPLVVAGRGTVTIALKRL